MSYTRALAKAQKKYRQTEKGRLANRKARRKRYEKDKDELKIPVLCSHCKKKYSGHYIKKHLRTQHYTT